MTSLAAVREEGARVQVQRCWGTTAIDRNDIEKIDKSFLEGIEALRLSRFVFPCGRIYFVRDWPVAKNTESAGPLALLASLAMAASGMIAGAVVSMLASFRHVHRFWLLGIAGALVVISLTLWHKKIAVSNGLLWVAAFLVGLAQRVGASSLLR